MNDTIKQNKLEENIQRFIHCNEKTRELTLESETDLIKQAGNISLPQLQIVLTVGAHEPCTMSDLAKILRLSQANITQLVTRLVDKKYLKRSPSREDRRVTYVVLLAKGKKVIELHDKHVQAFAMKWFDVMTDEEQEIMLSAWERVIKQNMASLHPQG